MTIRNLTMGEITIYDGNNPQRRLQSEVENFSDTSNAISGEMVVEKIDGIPVVELVLGKVNLPEPEEDTFLIVTRVVAEAAAAQGRTISDLLLPSHASAVRDSEGCNIIGYRQLVRLPR